MVTKGEELNAVCKEGLPGHRCPLLILGDTYLFRIDKFKYKFSIFNHRRIIVFWMDNGTRGTYFDSDTFKYKFHPKETLENFLLRLESEKYNL
jgi:hypothetical protein